MIVGGESAGKRVVCRKTPSLLSLVLVAAIFTNAAIGVESGTDADADVDVAVGAVVGAAVRAAS